MGDKKWIWGVVAASGIAYVLAANVVPLQESTVAVDRRWTVEGPHLEFCADVSLEGDMAIARPFAPFRLPAFARPGGATLHDVTTTGTIRECGGPDATSAEEEGQTSAVLTVIIGDAACTPWKSDDLWSGDERINRGDTCEQSALRMQLAGPAGHMGSQGWGDSLPVSADGGCVEVSSRVLVSETDSATTYTTGGEAHIERICPADAS